MIYVTVEQLLCCILPFLDDYHDRITDKDLKQFVQIFNQMIHQHSEIDVVYIEYPTEEVMECSRLFDMYGETYSFRKLYLKPQEKERIRCHLTSLKETLVLTDPSLSVEDAKNIILKSIEQFNKQRVELKDKMKQKTKEIS